MAKARSVIKYKPFPAIQLIGQSNDFSVIKWCIEPPIKAPRELRFSD